MAGDPLNKRRHPQDVTHHLVDYVIEVALLGEVERGVKGHVGGQHELDLKERGDAERRVRVLQQVLQGATHGTAEALQNHAVHMLSVGLPLNGTPLSTQQRTVLLQRRRRRRRNMYLFYL